MTHRQLIKMTTAALMLVVGATLVVRHFAGRSQTTEATPTQAYFYDVKTGELFVVASAALPPITAPSGEGNGVRAIMYACGECQADQVQIGYLERLTDKGKQAVERLNELRASGEEAPAELVEAMDRERYVALSAPSGQEPVWASLQTPQGQQIVDRFWALCDGNGRPRRCNPSQ